MALEKTLKENIYDALVADSTYLGYLGTPTSAPYRTYWTQPPEPPDLPQVELRFLGATVRQDEDRPFEIGDNILRVTIRTRDSACENIADRVIRILHHATASGRSWRAVLSGRPGELRDTRTNSWIKVLQFQVFYNGATI